MNKAPDLTPDLSERLQAILDSPSYKVAYEDLDLLAEDDLRPLRLQLELLKPDRVLREQGVHSTIVVFGSARTSDAVQARKQLDELERQQNADPSNPKLKRQLTITRRRLDQAHYYEEARRFAKLVSMRFQQRDRCDFVVVTGGGPGIMEAANRGAFDAGARSIGLNITLPHEQTPNPYITPELAFRFHYFALRKMHFLLQARGLVTFPGGYGTLDELFEVLTLIQTEKMPRIPVILVGREYWRRLIDFEYLVDEGYIAAEDINLFEYADQAEDILAIIDRFYSNPANKVC